jgi:glycosyltransferase involved in cell wall biosynthesis
MKILYIVVPCYNEQAVLQETASQLKAKLSALIASRSISQKSKILLVDDGSKDNTWDIITSLHQKSSKIVGIKLAKNKGHQNALLAGLLYAKDHADFIISLDADLQDDIGALDAFIEKNNEGYEIIYGVRSSREPDSFFKKQTARFFYKFMQLMGVDIIYDHADYRLMTKRAAEELANYRESNLFLRGIIPLMGLKSTTIKYKRNPRFAGTSKYPLKKMLSFALDGVTSFSVRPIRFIFHLGIFIFLISIIAISYSLIVNFFGATVSGWTFIACSIWLLGGIQMISIGVIGEYIGKTLIETKSRPRYFIEETLND